jgi:hypothetical protein
VNGIAGENPILIRLAGIDEEAAAMVTKFFCAVGEMNEFLSGIENATCQHFKRS